MLKSYFNWTPQGQGDAWKGMPMYPLHWLSSQGDKKNICFMRIMVSELVTKYAKTQTEYVIYMKWWLMHESVH